MCVYGVTMTLTARNTIILNYKKNKNKYKKGAEAPPGGGDINIWYNNIDMI